MYGYKENLLYSCIFSLPKLFVKLLSKLISLLGFRVLLMSSHLLVLTIFNNIIKEYLYPHACC